jgi:hypothetical protein
MATLEVIELARLHFQALVDIARRRALSPAASTSHVCASRAATATRET